MGFFGKKDDGTKCKKCDLEFSSPERLERHAEKAHSKELKNSDQEEYMGNNQNQKSKEPKRIFRLNLS